MGNCSAPEAEVEFKNQPSQAFLDAVCRGDVAEAARLRKENAIDVNLAKADLSFQGRPLPYAIDANQSGMAAKLIEWGADAQNHAESVLSLLVRDNHPAPLDSVLKRGLNPHHGTLVKLAVEHGNHGALKVLLKFEADPDKPDNTRRTAAHEAASRNDEAALLLLFNHQADKNKQDDTGRTPAHMAAQGSNFEALECLLIHGADPSIADTNGMDVWASAPSHARLSAIKIAFEQGRMFRPQNAAYSAGDPLKLLSKKLEVELDKTDTRVCTVKQFSRMTGMYLCKYRTDERWHDMSKKTFTIVQPNSSAKKLLNGRRADALPSAPPAPPQQGGAAAEEEGALASEWPTSLCDPVTSEPLVDPVITPNGHTFSRHVIERIIDENGGCCPLTNMPLTKGQLTPNRLAQDSVARCRDHPEL